MIRMIIIIIITLDVRRYSPGEVTSPLELVQSLLSGRLAPGAHVIITSRPHTLTYLQVISVINLMLYVTSSQPSHTSRSQHYSEMNLLYGQHVNT